MLIELPCLLLALSCCFHCQMPHTCRKYPQPSFSLHNLLPDFFPWLCSCTTCLGSDRSWETLKTRVLPVWAATPSSFHPALSLIWFFFFPYSSWSIILSWFFYLLNASWLYLGLLLLFPQSESTLRSLPSGGFFLSVSPPYKRLSTCLLVVPALHSVL